MFDTFKNRLEITGVLTTITALRISAGRSTEPIGTDLPVIKDAFGRPLIPGSSFKGALRSRLESFLRGILGSDRKLVANPAIEEEWSLKASEAKALKKLGLDQLIIFRRAREIEDFAVLSIEILVERIHDSKRTDHIKPEDVMSQSELIELKKKLLSEKKYTVDCMLTEAIVNYTDLPSLLFGSPWLASKFQVRDLTVLPDNWFGQYQERDGVAIDRDTETAADGKLYDFQVVPAGTPFEFRVVVENAEEWELGLLMIGLHQFETEQIPLGGGRSRGLGVVKLEINNIWWFDYPENEPEQLITYLKELVQDRKDRYLLRQETIKAHRDDWIEKLIEKLRQVSVKTTANHTSIHQEA